MSDVAARSLAKPEMIPNDTRNEKGKRMNQNHPKPKPIKMTLAKARQTLKAYTTNKLGHDDAGQVHEAIEALVKSWSSKARHGEVFDRNGGGPGGCRTLAEGQALTAGCKSTRSRLNLEKELWCGQLRRVIATLQAVLDCAEKYGQIPADTLPKTVMNLATIHGNAVALEYEALSEAATAGETAESEKCKEGPH